MVRKEVIICAYNKPVKFEELSAGAGFDYTYKDGELLDATALAALEYWKWGKWLPGNVTFGVETGSIDEAMKGQTRLAVGMMFQMVQPFVKDIKFVRSVSARVCDIPLVWRERDDYLRAPGRGNTIAYTTMPVGDPRTMPYDQRCIVFDELEEWEIFGRPYQDPLKNPQFPNTWYRRESVVYTGGHELSHKLGIPHGKTGMMYPYVSSNPVPVVDKELESRLYQVYGRPNIFQRKLNAIRRWRLKKAGMKMVQDGAV